MPAPFLYPRERHRRRLSPEQYKRYQTYKKHLRQEFAKQCVYCRMPDGTRGSEAFGVDHYKPQGLFPQLVVDYDNLFYACNACNSRKGDYWPSPDESARGVFVPNPCDHKMASHVRYKAGRVEGRSVAGKWLIDLVQLNDKQLVRYRVAMLATIKTLKEKIGAIRKDERQVRRAMKSAGAGQRKRLEVLVSDLEAKRAELEEGLLFHASGP